MSSPVARLRPAAPPAVAVSRRRFGGSARSLLVFALACAVSRLADAQASLLHEFIAPDPAEDVSLATTTGFANVDYSDWTTLAVMTLVALMFVGGCAGSAAGSGSTSMTSEGRRSRAISSPSLVS